MDGGRAASETVEDKPDANEDLFAVASMALTLGELEAKHGHHDCDHDRHYRGRYRDNDDHDEFRHGRGRAGLPRDPANELTATTRRRGWRRKCFRSL